VALGLPPPEHTAASPSPKAASPARSSLAEAHALRLALIYTLADGERKIAPEHLRASLALYDYAARSATWALQGATGDPLAEQIHTALERNPAGLTRSQVQNVLAHNRPAAEIHRALAALALAGRATHRQLPTTGRPAELWTAASPGKVVCVRVNDTDRGFD